MANLTPMPHQVYDLIPQELRAKAVEEWDPLAPIPVNIGYLKYGCTTRHEFEGNIDPQWRRDINQMKIMLNMMAAGDRDPMVPPTANHLAALWRTINLFFILGPNNASYFFICFEAAIRRGSTTVRTLDIPAPPEFWANAAPWNVARSSMALLCVFASAKEDALKALAHFNRTLGPPEPNVATTLQRPLESLRAAYQIAKSAAQTLGKRTLITVSLRDLGFERLGEAGQGEAQEHVSFARMFALGVCPQGTKIWQDGGIGYEERFGEMNESKGDGLTSWDDLEIWLVAFEVIAVADGGKGRWVSKTHKKYRRCFGIDLKALGQGEKKLAPEYEAWVSLFVVEDIKLEDIRKYTWE